MYVVQLVLGMYIDSESQLTQDMSTTAVTLESTLLHRERGIVE